MMTSTAPPQLHMPSIGASMVEYIRRNSQSPESPETNGQRVQTDPDYPLPSDSLVAAMMGDSASTPTLLRGPRRSGRTTLLMNLAQTLASSEDYTKSCRGDCGGRACHCVAVVILRPARGDAENDKFPLSVSPVPENTNGNVQTTLAAQLEALEQSIEPRPPFPAWDTAALRRIRVHHVASFRDLLEYLLNLQALPVSQRPYRGILVDDVDVLARQTLELGHDANDTSHHTAHQQRSTLELMNLTQILALLADCAHVLQQQGGARSLRVMATMENGLPFNAEHMLSNWFPLSLELKPTDGKNWSHATLVQATGHGADVQMTFEDFWTLNRAGDENRKGKGKLELARVRSMDGSSRILWKKGETE